MQDSNPSSNGSSGCPQRLPQLAKALSESGTPLCCAWSSDLWQAAPSLLQTLFDPAASAVPAALGWLFPVAAGRGSWGQLQVLCTLQLHPKARVGFGPNSLFAFVLGEVQGGSRQLCSEGAVTAHGSRAVNQEGKRECGTVHVLRAQTVTPQASLCCSVPRAGLRTGVLWAGAQIAPVCELGGVCFISQ